MYVPPATKFGYSTMGWLTVFPTALLWILWISAGVSTASFASANQDFHIFGPRTCDDLGASPNARTICSDSKPTTIFDIATGAIRKCDSKAQPRWVSLFRTVDRNVPTVLLYTAALVIVASSKSYGGRSIWSMTVKECEV